MILLFGMPRSGTTWVAKIFDSHPKTLYRHEPDISLPETSFPFLLTRSQIEEYIPVAQNYLERLINERKIRTTGILPLFKKEYLNNFEYIIRLIIILSIKTSEKIKPLADITKNVSIPDFVDIRSGKSTIVIKSVIALGRARLFSSAASRSKTIIILRHPCGQIASTLKGFGMNLFGITPPIRDLARTEQAQRQGLSLEDFKKMDLIEQLAWTWGIFNEKALQDMGEDAYVLRYEDLCCNPVAITKQLFEFTGLSWNDQTDLFLRASTHCSKRQGYFQIYKNTSQQPYKWQNQLDQTTINKILNITKKTELGHFYSQNF